MMLPKNFIYFLFLLSTLAAGRCASIDGQQGRRSHHLDEEHQSHSYSVTKLFVFGDSYADTGNRPKGLGDSWKHPYGITFPGEPSGRFSDGRVLTDYVAKFYGLKSPVPYRLMKYAGYKLRYGVNFAYGGTGVFDTFALFPNMTTQIDLFEKLLNQFVYTKTDLQSSLFILSVAGNDYGTYKINGGTAEVCGYCDIDGHMIRTYRYDSVLRATSTQQGVPAYATSVVNQIVANLKRLHGLGARKIVVTTLAPIGCLPHSTIPFGFQQCNASEERDVGIHNLFLAEAVRKLSNENKDSSFTILDLFGSFTTGLFNKGSSRFETPLKPCCMGIREGYFCGSVDDKGERMYTLCEDRESAFFWDDLHPTQAGWRAVSTLLRSTLQLIH